MEKKEIIQRLTEIELLVKKAKNELKKENPDICFVEDILGEILPEKSNELFDLVDWNSKY